MDALVSSLSFFKARDTELAWIDAILDKTKTKSDPSAVVGMETDEDKGTISAPSDFFDWRIGCRGMHLEVECVLDGIFLSPSPSTMRNAGKYRLPPLQRKLLIRSAVTKSAELI